MTTCWIDSSAAFGYFLSAYNPTNGLVADRSITGSPCSIAVVGFALSSYPVAVERRWMTRDEAVERTLATLRFFLNSPQSEAPDATGYKGFYYHFLDMQNGRRVWQSELSLIDTALLLAGILTAGAYFTGSTWSASMLLLSLGTTLVAKSRPRRMFFALVIVLLAVTTQVGCDNGSGGSGGSFGTGSSGGRVPASTQTVQGVTAANLENSPIIVGGLPIVLSTINVP